MQRRALRFGRHQHLIGVVHEAATDGQRQNLGAVLWNTGISNRTGPYRINAEIAEVLGGLGVSTLRFDLSRLGDSDDSAENLPVQDRCSLDIADAVNVLTRDYGISRVLLIGLCSSAVDAYYYARGDERIQGMLMVDPFVYPTPAHRMLSFLQKLSSPRRWQRFIKRKFLSRRFEARAEALDYFEPNYPPPEEASKDLKLMLARGVKMLVIYTGGFSAYFSHVGQFAAMLGVKDFGPALRILRWPKTDHLFTMLEDRSKFLSTMKNWVASELQLSSPNPIAGNLQAPQDLHRASAADPLPIDVEAQTEASFSQQTTLGEADMSSAQSRLTVTSSEITKIMEQQLRLMEQQLEILRSLVPSRLDGEQEGGPAFNLRPAGKSPVHFVDSLPLIGEIELHTDKGAIVLPHYEGAFVATDAEGQAALFIENPKVAGEIWQILVA